MNVPFLDTTDAGESSALLVMATLSMMARHLGSVAMEDGENRVKPNSPVKFLIPKDYNFPIATMRGKFSGFSKQNCIQKDDSNSMLIGRNEFPTGKYTPAKDANSNVHARLNAANYFS